MKEYRSIAVTKIVPASAVALPAVPTICQLHCTAAMTTGSTSDSTYCV